MLKDSKLVSFIDKEQEYTLHFVEGQKIVHDLAMIHDLKGKGFAFFRDCVLSAIPLVTLLKFGETLGFYIDSEDPYFMFKVEMSEDGYFRTLLMPETLSDFPERITGRSRLTKIFASQKTPYNSVTELKDLPLSQAVNTILTDSYQVNGRVIVSEDSDQAAFIMQLPRKDWDKESDYEFKQTIDEKINSLKAPLDELFKKGTNEVEDIIPFITNLEFDHLKSKELHFKCNCSYQRMLAGVSSLTNSSSIDDIFEGKDSIETKCDYCKTFYQIPKDAVLAFLRS